MTSRNTSRASPRYVEEDPDAGIFRVSRRAFVEEEVLERERRQLFDRCWLYVGHASEIRQPGDFLTRNVGGRELIFSRDRSGAVRAFLNTCPHRGAMVCREKQGNANGFRCFYHSWLFGLDGRLVNRPGDEAYSSCTREAGRADLTAVPRLDHHRDLYFVNYRPDGMSLRDYLADAAEYIDLIADQSEAGMEIVGGTQEYGVEANWKLLCENSYDGYHGMPTHVSYFDYLQSQTGSLVARKLDIGSVRDLGNGHAVIEYAAPWGRPVASPVPAWGEAGAQETAAFRARLEARFGAARAERIATLNRNMVIFPNLVLNDIMALTVRTFYPTGPGRMVVNAWALAPREESPSMRERRLFNFLEFLGPGGFATPDDCEALALCQRGYSNLAEAGWNDISKGMLSTDPKIDDEVQMRVFWREWNRLMTGEMA
jgi:p-cumate 2,3-dioxygenase alpha subunit